MKTIDSITGYHAHLYYDEKTFELAQQVCREAARQLPVTPGRMHRKPVGPHPCWSCQLAFAPQHVGIVLSWLALNRQGLTVFLHPETGDDLIDHTNHAVWMGHIEPLDLGIFTKKSF